MTDKKIKQKYEENAAKLNSRKIKLPKSRRDRDEKMGKLGVFYCSECRKYYSISLLKEKSWWNGDPEDPGDIYYTCPREHQVDVE